MDKNETREVGDQRGVSRFFLPSEEREKIAQVCHEANRAYCMGQGDYSQPSWDDAPDWQRESARNGVDAITSGKVTQPSQSHESWYAEKEAAGWTYGPEKNPDLKQHPCMVAYSQLPASQRMKDHLFLAIVQTLAGDIG